MNSNHIAMLYGVARVLEDFASDADVTIGDVHQALADVYAVINECGPDSSSVNKTVATEDPLIFKFDDYINKNGNNFPRGAA